jgi:hypothetical protein
MSLTVGRGHAGVADSQAEASGAGGRARVVTSEAFRLGGCISLMDASCLVIAFAALPGIGTSFTTTSFATAFFVSIVTTH